MADEVIITPVFSAWENDGNTIDATRIVNEIKNIPVTFRDDPFSALARDIFASIETGDLIVVMGAGDISELVTSLLRHPQLN